MSALAVVFLASLATALIITPVACLVWLVYYLRLPVEDKNALPVSVPVVGLAAQAGLLGLLTVSGVLGPVAIGVGLLTMARVPPRLRWFCGLTTVCGLVWLVGGLLNVLPFALFFALTGV